MSNQKKFLIRVFITFICVVFLSSTSINCSINLNFIKNIEDNPIPPEIESDDFSSKTPSNYDALTNFKIARYYLLSSKSFTSESTGYIKASGFSQSIKGSKKYDGENYFSEAISYSIFKQLANRIFYNGNDITILQGTHISKDTASWNGKSEIISKDEYRKRYGGLPTAFIRYIVDSNTILSKHIEKKDNNLYTLSFSLNPLLATKAYVNEIMTSSGSVETPIFNSIIMYVTIDNNWIIQEMTIVENYDIKLSFLPGTQNATSKITETFSNINGTVILSTDELLKG